MKLILLLLQTYAFYITTSLKGHLQPKENPIANTIKRSICRFINNKQNYQSKHFTLVWSERSGDDNERPSPLEPITVEKNLKAYDFSELTTDNSNRNKNLNMLSNNSFDWGRFISYNTLAIFLAIGANFLGITSLLMTQTNPELFRSLKLDQLYSVGGYRRYVSTENQYEFIFPDNWLIDQSVLLSNINNRDLPAPLRAKMMQRALVQPDVAYASPPLLASTNDDKKSNVDVRENLSVIRSSVLPGFSLRGTLGSPSEAADRLLSSVIAPATSGKTYSLVSASEETRNGVPTYIFEYVIDRNSPTPEIHQHTVSVVASRGTELYTLTATVPSVYWDAEQARIRDIANSFSLSAGLQNVPKGFY